MTSSLILPVPQGEPGIPRPVQRSTRSGHWGQTGQGHCLLRSTISDIVVYRVLPGCHHIWTKWSNQNYGSYDVQNKFVTKNVLNLHSLKFNDSSCKYFWSLHICTCKNTSIVFSWTFFVASMPYRWTEFCKHTQQI